jgi:hypothetical protein
MTELSVTAVRREVLHFCVSAAKRALTRRARSRVRLALAVRPADEASDNASHAWRHAHSRLFLGRKHDRLAS